MSAKSNHEIVAGFMPLLDSAILVAAKERGFAADEGIDLRLIRETSWASIRDRMAVGHFQVAHLLAPMPIAANLGLTPLAAKTIAPIALGLGGNAVTVSNALWAQMAEHGATASLDPALAGRALRLTISQREGDWVPPLKFAVVHPFSGHNYELRYWLAASGIAPDREVEIVILPPPLMADALAAGTIDGYCVGEPWSTAATTAGVGHIATVKAAIWRSSPEKVLGAAANWAEREPDALAALLRALCLAAQWCSSAENHEELAQMLAEPNYVARPADWLLRGLSGKLDVGGEGTKSIEDFFVPFAKGATFPWKSHALWFYSQMVRWGQAAHTPENAAIARETYRPDIYRSALKPLGIALPAANAKVEGALRTPTPVGSTGASLTLGPDGFFDGALFDPDKLDQYIDAQKL
ncbi:CmpA/NrtA family ABC transporter substrate-binding protein [Hyphomicrobium sp. NDB2Meth4]|uniref:CmpA/NrtA family ABC transporter substrate-binding protein n=1 Tax=Hyphomicrobium sp. NDB2Meth4 TaxID=1892846 RepID=UPI000931C5D5|nr:CmpA/NrtA family ABC transporter substrate-binding protein [Hyphomicrobium sp. NDB2Meth4]